MLQTSKSLWDRFEPLHEKRDLIVYRFVVLQMRVRSAMLEIQVCVFTRNFLKIPNISNSKGLTEILRDIHTSTYQSWESVENNKINNHI